MCLGGVARRSASGPLWPPAERKLLDDGELLIVGSRLESQLRLYLDHPRRNITPETSTQDSGRRLLQVENPSVGCRQIRAPVVRKSKVWMIEKVEELKTNTQLGILPVRDLRVFHDSEVSVEVAWPSKMISSLREGH